MKFRCLQFLISFCLSVSILGRPQPSYAIISHHTGNTTFAAVGLSLVLVQVFGTTLVGERTTYLLRNKIQRLEAASSVNSVPEIQTNPPADPLADLRTELKHARINKNLLWTAVTGLTLLEANPILSFEPLTEEEQTHLGLSEVEATEYMKFRPALNAKLESIAAEMGEVPSEGLLEYLQKAADKWQEEESIPETALLAGAKIIEGSLLESQEQ